MSTPYFIDTNVFIYAKGREHALKSPCLRVIQKIRDGDISAIISTEIIQEILTRFQSIKKNPIGIQLAKEAMLISYRILPINERDLSLAIELLEMNPKIETRDCFHAATMINNGIKEIISTDPHFDLISEIKRIDPSQLP